MALQQPEDQMGRCWGRGAGNTWRQSQTPASTCLRPAAPPLAADPARLPSGPRVPHVRLFGFPGRSAPSAPSSVRTSKPVSQAETPAPHTAQGARRCWTRALPAKVAGDAQGKPEKPNRAPAMLAGPLAHLPPTTARGAGCPGKRSCPGHRGPRGALTQQCSQPGDDSAAHLRAGKPRLAAEDGLPLTPARAPRPPRRPVPRPAAQAGLSGSQRRSLLKRGCLVLSPPATWEPDAPPSRRERAPRGSCLDLVHICSSFHAPRDPRFLRL